MTAFPQDPQPALKRSGVLMELGAATGIHGTADRRSDAATARTARWTTSGSRFRAYGMVFDGRPSRSPSRSFPRSIPPGPHWRICGRSCSG